MCFIFMNNFKLLVNKYYNSVLLKKLKGYKLKFRNKYILWFHNLDTNDWSFKSYQKIYEIKNICDFWSIYNNHYCLHNGMYFLMKNDIKPLYESEDNKNGGCWSIKLNNNVFKIWLNLCLDFVGSILDENNIINGLSISFKHRFYIIKIWINDSKYNNIDDINIDNTILKKFNIFFNKYK